MTDTENVPSTKAMIYDPDRRTLVTEASDLRWAAGCRPRAVRVRSHRTGRVVEFVHLRTHWDRDGDVTHWEYRHHATGVVLVVFND